MVDTPTVGGDTNAWGSILNNALLEHDEAIADALATAEEALTLGQGAATPAAVTAAVGALSTVYAQIKNAQRDASFGAPQHEDGANYTYPTLLNFGAVNPAPPVTSVPAPRGIDVIAHWYNDFGLDSTALSATQANGSYTWYDWKWNKTTNTGDGVTTYGYDQQRHPLQGFYKGDNANVLDWQCKWIAEAGVNAVSLVKTAGFHRTTSGVDWSDPASTNYWMYQLFHNCPNFQALRYIPWIAYDGTEANIYAQRDEVIWLYSNYPNGYTYTENGKTYAVVYIWDASVLRGALDNFSGAVDSIAHIKALATAFQGIGYAGVAVLARNPEWMTSGTYISRQEWLDSGVLAFSTDYSNSQSSIISPDTYGNFSGYASKLRFNTSPAVVPNVNTSYDTVYPHPSNQNLSGSTPALFGKALRRACDQIVRDNKPRMVLINNMSEWAESGPGLIPNKQDGFGYLDQVRSLPSYAPSVEVAREATFTWDPGSVSAGASVTTTVTVSRLKVSNLAFVQVAAPYSLQGLIVTGYASGTDTVTVVLSNPTGGAVDLASGTWRVRVTGR